MPSWDLPSRKAGIKHPRHMPSPAPQLLRVFISRLRSAFLSSSESRFHPLQRVIFIHQITKAQLPSVNPLASGNWKDNHHLRVVKSARSHWTIYPIRCNANQSLQVLTVHLPSLAYLGPHCPNPVHLPFVSPPNPREEGEGSGARLSVLFWTHGGLKDHVKNQLVVELSCQRRSRHGQPLITSADMTDRGAAR